MIGVKVERMNNRYLILIIFVIIFSFILILRLFDLQVVHGEEYKAKSEKKLNRIATSYAPRGDIYDRNGKLLATSEVIYNLNLYRTKKKNDELNELLINIADILLKNGDKYVNNFPIDFETLSFKYSNEKLKNWKKENSINENATVAEAIATFTSKYKLHEYDDVDKSVLIPLRYELSTVGYSNYKAVTIAEGISQESVHELEEKNFELSGIYIYKDTKRIYPYGNTLSHIIGYTGKINATEYESRKDQGYTLNSIIGKSGVERSFENYLRGINGTKRIEMDSSGVINNEEELEKSRKGADLYLTIDIDFQKKTEEALAKIIQRIQNGDINKLKFEDATTGAAVVTNVKTGEVLSIASFPDFNPQDFVDGLSNEKYNQYFNDKDKPMYNRAIQGLYPPGSTFKMVTGIAGIESGAVGVDEYIKDVGIFNMGHKPACWLWNARKQVHGNVNARTALKVSCNYYYYEVSSRMGIDTLAEYARKFGLGEKTGIEVYGEEKGTVSSREYINEQNEKGKNLTWSIGDTLSSAIGQSYNLYTPVQMCQYISTIANKGHRTDLTILKDIKYEKDNDLKIEEVKNEIDSNLGVLEQKREDIEIKDTTLKAIFEGMKSVTGDRGGTVYGTFNDFPIEVAGKTGTATSGNGSDNAWFVGFAPYDDPEIAVVVIVEHGGHGYFTAWAVKDIMESYFGFNNET